MNDLSTSSDSLLPRGAISRVRNDEETLIADDRAALSPSQLVEQRLIGMLKGSSLPVSHIQRWMKPGPR